MEAFRSHILRASGPILLNLLHRGVNGAVHRLAAAEKEVEEAGRVFAACCADEIRLDRACPGTQPAHAALANTIGRALTVYLYGRRHRILLRIRDEADALAYALSTGDRDAVITGLKQFNSTLAELPRVWRPRGPWRG